MATFHLFPSLPFEIRSRIWKFTIEPRTVEVRVFHKLLPPFDRLVSGPSVQYLATLTPVPATLHACREARHLGLYQQGFSELSDDPDVMGRRYIWLSWELDMISIGTELFSTFFPVAPHIKRLKFERKYSDEVYFHFEARDIYRFVNLKEIHVVCADGFGAWHGASEYPQWPCGAENVLCIDPDDGQTVMRLTELDEMHDRMLEEAYEKENEELARREAQQ